MEHLLAGEGPGRAALKKDDAETSILRMELTQEFYFHFLEQNFIKLFTLKKNIRPLSFITRVTLTRICVCSAEYECNWI